jgi:hypothetical protein
MSNRVNIQDQIKRRDEILALVSEVSKSLTVLSALPLANI